jgi:hypothetical protein
MKLKPLPFPKSYNEIGARREPQSSRPHWHPRVRVCERASIRQGAPATAHWQLQPCDFKAAHAGATRSTGSFQHLRWPADPERRCFAFSGLLLTRPRASGWGHWDASFWPLACQCRASIGPRARLARSTWPQWTRLGLALRLRLAAAGGLRSDAPARGPGPSRDRDPRGAGHVASQQSRASGVRVRAALSWWCWLWH